MTYVDVRFERLHSRRPGKASKKVVDEKTRLYEMAGRIDGDNLSTTVGNGGEKNVDIPARIKIRNNRTLDNVLRSI